MEGGRYTELAFWNNLEEEKVATRLGKGEGTGCLTTYGPTPSIFISFMRGAAVKDPSHWLTQMSFKVYLNQSESRKPGWSEPLISKAM